MMNMIVAVDKNWSIGKDGHLLVSIPADQKLFREETMGKVVVMGRKTLESLPGGQPLYGRTTIVLSRNLEYKVKGQWYATAWRRPWRRLKNTGQRRFLWREGSRYTHSFYLTVIWFM